MSTRLEFDKIREKIAFYASFSLSKQLILELEPEFSALKLRRELKRTEDALKLVVSHGGLSFGGIQDISVPLIFAGKGGVLEVEDIVDIGRFIQGVRRIKNQFAEIEGEYPALEDLFDSLEVSQELLEHINFTYSEQAEVLDRASDVLRDIRKNIKSIESSIDKQSQDFLNRNKSILSEAVISLQHGRQTFLIKPSEKNKMDGTIYGTSASGQSVYFEPAFLAKLQNELAGAQAREQEEIERICRDTSKRIGNESQQILADLETATLIDVVMAKAQWGKNNDGIVAKLTENRLHLKNARHPLIDKKTVVANDYSLLPPYKMILISGPNTGGKSVSLKTMGLSVLMTHAACPVLCDEAEVMFVDHIFVDIGDQQSIEKSLSSFSAHMQTMTTVSEKATSRSLILLDELGSQTDPLEGESLSMALLDYFREVGCWVIATTHFSRLKEYGTRHDDVLIASVAFDIQTMMPTYHYRENIMGESNAFAIARRLGLDASIIDQATEYKEASQYETDHMMEILEAKILEQDHALEALKDQQQEVETMKQHMEQERLRFEKEKERIRLELIEEQEEKVAKLVEEAEAQLQVLNKTNRPDMRQKAVKKVQSLQKETVDETIGVGDRVQLKATNQVGVVESIEKKAAFISVGGLKVTVDLNKLIKIAGPAPKAKKRVQKSHSVRSQSSMNTECNLIGMRVAEALPLMDKFIDDAILNKLQKVRIVHGHGTGQLRQAVHDRLRKHKYVSTFELASMSEGGMGATVVTLKQP